jgi:hypothetical protein
MVALIGPLLFTVWGDDDGIPGWQPEVPQAQLLWINMLDFAIGNRCSDDIMGFGKHHPTLW